jgi:hypothetical protein
MSSARSRQFIFVLIAFAVAAGNLLVPASALADQALFRAEQRFYNFPNPPVTTPGGAGLYQAYLQPYTYYYNPAVATVQAGNPIGGAFTLPTGFINFTGTYSNTPQTAWPGYTTITYVSYYNGPGKFQPNFGSTASNVRVVFPTTGGNPLPTYNGTAMKWTGGNLGIGNPITPTTTFDGRYDISRGGSIQVTPGPNRFGGTFRLFYGPSAGWYMYVYYFTPAVYKGYGYYLCFDEGNFGCTPSTFMSTAGDVTAIYFANRYLLNVTGTGTGPGYSKNTAKATTSTTANGRWPTPNGNASFLVVGERVLNVIHPWTTGYARVHNAKGSPKIITPQAQGYDTDLGDADITVTRYGWYQNFNTTNQTLTTYTLSTKQYLSNVGRVVSLVRPRLIHSYLVPLDETADPITNVWNVARMWGLRVFFLPEPSGMLLLGVGIAAVLGLSRMRRR